MKNNVKTHLSDVGNGRCDAYVITEKELSFLTQIKLPERLEGFEARQTSKGRFRPEISIPVEFTVTLADGTVTTLEGAVTLWLNKKHSETILTLREREAIRAKQEKEAKVRQKKIKEGIKEAGISKEQLAKLVELGVVEA